MISASMVKDIREKTGAGMLDCKKALEETNGNIDAAIDWLREKGISKAAKKAAKKEEKVDLSTLTLAELKAMAKEKEIKGYSKLKKEELIEVLK